MDRFEEAKLRVKEATDLVALIESYLPLRPRGRLLVALCPFHAENSPSFTVYREEQYFRCYGCSKTGDAFTWLMERDGLTFREAMEQLADRAGISLEGVFKGGAQRDAKGPDPYEALAQVAGFFQRALLAPEAGKLARAYIEQRGLSEAIEPWRLGFHPAPGALQRFVREQDLPVEVVEQAGLLRNGREPFAQRVIFPIEDERGRTVGFGGRILPGAPGSDGDGDYKPPKYLNSPESPFFNKRRVLFGLHRAKMAGQRRIVVMEGYTDVIACHLAGFQGAVASLGTAFTAEHARTVERYATQGLILMFDGDRAGMQAAERAAKELVNSRLNVRIAMMGDADGGAKDPADVVVARPGEDPELVGERRARFADVLDGAEDWLAVWFRLLRRRLDFSQPANVEAAARECTTLLGLVETPVRQAAMVEQMARHLSMPAHVLERMLQRAPKRQESKRAEPSTQGRDGAGRDGAGRDGAGRDGAGRGGANGESVPAAPLSPLERADIDLVACVLARPPLLEGLDLELDGPGSPAAAQLLAWAIDGLALGRAVPAELVRYLFARAAEQPAVMDFLGVAHARAQKMPEPHVVLAGLVSGRRRLSGDGQRRLWRQQLTDAIAVGDTARAAELQQLLLERMRGDRPRPERTGPPPPQKRMFAPPAAAPPAGAPPAAPPDSS